MLLQKIFRSGGSRQGIRVKLYVKLQIQIEKEAEFGGSLFCFIVNSDFWKHKKEHMFIERMLDKHVFGHDNRTKEMLEDIKTFDTSLVSKQVIFI